MSERAPMTTPTAAVERLRMIRADKSVLLTIYGTAVESAQARHYGNDVDAVIDAYLRETDTTPITQDFARSVAVERDCGGTTWFQVWTEQGQNVWLHHAFDGKWELKADKNNSPLIKTLGEYYTYCRLFGVNVKGA